MLKKALHIIIALLITGQVFAGGSKEDTTANSKIYNTKDFTEVSISGGFNYTIRQGNDFLVKIFAGKTELKKISVEQQGSQLTIKRNSGYTLFGNSKNEARIEIIMPKIEKLYINGASAGSLLMDNRSVDSSEIEVNGASQLELNSAFSKLKISVIGASKLTGKLVAETCEAHFIGASDGKLKYESKNTKITANGASGVELIGKAQKSIFDANGGSEIDGRNFETDELKAIANGASSIFAKIRVSGDLNANGASSITYSGTKTVTKEKNGASDILYLESL